MRIHRAISTPIRDIANLPFDDIWNRGDHGLIVCWEKGRQMAVEQPDVAAAAARGELPPLAWKGGVEGHIKAGKKPGCHHYLAQLAGLRGEDLDIDTEATYHRTCTKFSVTVTYTLSTSGD